MKKLFLGALCGLVLACAVGPPDHAQLQPDGIAAVSLTVAVDAHPLVPFTLASLDVTVAPAHALVAPPDSEVAAVDTGESSPDTGRPVRAFDTVTTKPGPHGLLRAPLNRLLESERDSSRINRRPGLHRRVFVIYGSPARSLSV